MAILVLKIADTVEVNKITIKCIFQIDEIMEYGNKCVVVLLIRWSLRLKIAMVLCRPLLLCVLLLLSGAVPLYEASSSLRMNIIANIRCAE